MAAKPKTIAAIGCSGHVAETIVHGLLKGANVRLLARDADLLRLRYPDASIIEGSMMNADDVARTMNGVDAALLLTPMARRNNATTEIAPAKSVIAGAHAAGLKHLVYASAIGAAPGTGVGLLDAKYEVERLVVNSEIPYSILRCGGFMQDIFAPRKRSISAGRFVYPLTRSRRFSYTDQSDIAPFMIQELMNGRGILNSVTEFVDPATYSISEIETALTDAAGTPVKVTPHFPAFYALLAARPYFHLRNHRFASIIPLLRHFDRYGCVATETSADKAAPTFPMTNLHSYLAKLLQ